MPSRTPLRLILIAALAVGAALLIGLVVGALNGLIEFYRHLTGLPLWMRLPLVVVVAVALLALAGLVWHLLRPGPSTRRQGQPPTRAGVQQRIEDLRQRKADTSLLEGELAELDRRAASGEFHVALFGEISTGKSSLVRALAPEATPDVDVRGGTTREVRHYRGQLPDGRELVLADVPGIGEVDGDTHARLARDEALRAHAVVVLCASDLTGTQAAEIDRLAGFGKPLLLAVNKIDQFDASQRAALLARLAAATRGRVDAIVAISAGGSERFDRALPDGRLEHVERERVPVIATLTAALERISADGAAALEPAREAAILASIDARGDALARAAAATESRDTVSRYTRRAMVGALAAVVPGSDILIQGALGTALVRELARIHGVAVRDLDVEALLARLGLTVRNTTAIVLAIAGNALKAFPGLGTLGGGALHAVAYGLVFDSVGRALSETLAEHASLDAEDAERRVRDLLAQPARERVQRIARLALDVASSRKSDDDGDDADGATA
jgi:GTP-binding protein EngB required for normal cell division